MNFRRLFLLFWWGIITSNLVIAQNNLVINNPDFVNDVSHYSSWGDVTLVHDTAGALTPGSAKLTVHSVDGTIWKVGFGSEKMTLPDSVKGKLLFFTFYAKSPDSVKTRLKFYLYNDQNSYQLTKSSTFLLTDQFKPYSIPIRPFENATTFKFVMDIGELTGTYYFDDFSLFESATPVDSIRKFEEDNWTPRFFKRPDSTVETTLPSTLPDVTLNIDLDSVLAKVTYTQFGVNANFRSRDGIVDRYHLYEQFGALRYPAGSGSNIYFWDCNIPDTFAIDINTYCGTASNFTDPDHFITFKQRAGGEPTIVVNYFYARYGVTPEGTRAARVQQAADYAASWVHYMNVEKGAGIKYWEIGNECYGSWETGYNVNGSIVTGKEYGEDLCVFAQRMKAADSTIKIGAVLSHNKFQWNNEVMAEVGDAADFLIVHHYFNVADRSSSVSAVNEMTWDMQELQAAAYHYSGKPKGHFPVAFTEFNIQGKPTTSMMNGLFMADALGNLVKSGFFLSTVWVNEWNVSDFETHGILAKNDPYQADYTARPSYTPYYYYGKCFGDLMVNTTLTGTEDVRAYASTFASGEIGVVLLNYSDTLQKVKWQFADTTKIDTAFWYTVYADSIADGNTKFYVNGITSATVGGGPENLDSVFAYKAYFADSSLFPLLPNSVTYMVLKKRYSSSPSGSWYGSFSTDWSTAYNWADKRVPDSTTDVVVPASPQGNRFPETIKNPPAVCRDLIIEHNAHVTIPDSSTVVIKGKLEIK